ncbi:ilGF domain-containing protein [Trichonephila inaurata madagascariensis]|uniref:IlGF domain-containing protein n=1 Tax=Trichonephila inaurata madagascariensis TaxID=2747483 RepID=A0A8X6XTD5_9ARAC|nr:ilGF domain-containing protein [Trichonephila inaurata madagascariensis]
MNFSYFKFLMMSLVLFAMLQPNSVQSVRLCGKRLADLLHYLCQHYGGFHAPESKRSGNNENQNPEADSSLSTVLQSGIVDECCRKHCTLTTLISYCADGQNIASNRLAEIENMFSSGSRTLTEIQMREDMATDHPESANSPLGSNTESVLPNIPNLGTSNRNRPVFIVLPQVYESAGSDFSSEETQQHGF